MSDRIMVMFEGKKVAMLDKMEMLDEKSTSPEEIMAYATGVKKN